MERTRLRQENAEIIEAIVESGVPLAAPWVFDLAQQEDSINVTPTNPAFFTCSMNSRRSTGGFP